MKKKIYTVTVKPLDFHEHFIFAILVNEVSNANIKGREFLMTLFH
jgi:hypothetical protein